MELPGGSSISDEDTPFSSRQFIPIGSSEFNSIRFSDFADFNDFNIILRTAWVL